MFSIYLKFMLLKCIFVNREINCMYFETGSKYLTSDKGQGKNLNVKMGN